MYNVYLTAGAATLCFVVGVLLVFSARYLVAFFHLCYSLSFVPLIATTWGSDAEFWTRSTFSYSPNSLVVYALSLIWFVSGAGLCISLFIFAKKSIKRENKIKKRSRKLIDTSIRAWSVVGLGAFAVCGFLVICRFFFLSVFESAFPGYDGLMCILILFCWSIIIIDENKYMFIAIFIITIMYIISQLITGDRNFFTFLVGISLLWMLRNKVRFFVFLKISTVAFFMVALAAYISMARMDVSLTIDDLLLFLRFNSWNAIILPVINMIEIEWVSGPLLLGKSYFDLFLSILPSPIYSIFGIEKAITTDNPARWFYIEGLGGMHASGVALRNFGVVGVFFQVFIFSVGLFMVENIVLRKNSTLRVFLFLSVSSVVMHALWYGLIYMVNVIVFFILISIVAIIFRGRKNYSK